MTAASQRKNEVILHILSPIPEKVLSASPQQEIGDSTGFNSHLNIYLSESVTNPQKGPRISYDGLCGPLRK
jgi:hypothetical protein